MSIVMQLPNAEKAFVDDQKLIDYCLSDSHPIGKHKAKVFKSALNYGLENFTELKNAILAGVNTERATLTHSNQYGNYYVLDLWIMNHPKQARVRTSWIVKRDEDFPRLTSCYIIM